MAYKDKQKVASRERQRRWRCRERRKSVTSEGVMAISESVMTKALHELNVISVTVTDEPPSVTPNVGIASARLLPNCVPDPVRQRRALVRSCN